MIDRRLKVRHLQAFVEITRQKSLKKAAQILNLTQPAISKTLKELESITGATLVERGRGGVLVTAEGEVFLQHARNSLTALSQAVSSVSALQKGEEGSLSVGALPSVTARVLPLAVQIFTQQSPNTRPRIEDGPHSYLVDRLRTGALDLVIGRLGKPNTMKGISFTQLYLEDVVVVCRPGHPLAETNVLANISTYQVIYPTKDSAIRPLVDRMMIANGLSGFPNSVESVSATFGRGLTLTSDTLWIISTGVVAADIAAGRLIALPINAALTAGPIGIMTRAEDEPSPLVRIFRHAMLKAVSDLALV